MRGFLDSLSIEEAGRRVEGLDLRNNTAARDVFIHVAIEYSRGALRKNGIDLLTSPRTLTCPNSVVTGSQAKRGILDSIASG